MKRIIACIAPVVAILAIAPQAHATPITYEISSTASGQIGATTFTNAQVDLIGIGDTAGVTPLFSAQLFANPFSTLTITIGGVGTAAITDPSEIWTVPTPGFGGSTVPLAVIGREDKVGGVFVLDSITGIGIIGSNALAGYEGATAIGPITDAGAIGFPVGCSTPGHDPCLHTSLGLLSFTANIDVAPAGEATFTATTVPEPATLFLLGSGVVALLGRRSRARKSLHT